MLLPRIRQPLPLSLSPELIAAALLLALGAALRLYAFGELPPGLHQDEAAVGYDAWAVLNFGMDRNGISWPVHFINWGGGAHSGAIYGYLTLPFIALGGLTAAMFRLPMLIGGILSLFLMWKIGATAAGRGFALLLLLLLSLNSWHLMASRWGLDTNLLPFLLLLSVYFLSRPDRGRLLIQAIAIAVLALSVYASVLAYAFAPLFLVLVLAWLRLNRLADWRRLLALAALAGLVALPIMLLVIINSFGLDTISVWGVSIPRYTGQPPRYETVNLLLGGDWSSFLANVPSLAALLLGSGDGRIDNALPGFGALPPLAILLSLVGLAVVLYRAKVHQDYGVHLLLAAWFAAALLTALTTEAWIHRINALWLPALYLMAVGIFFIGRHRRFALYALTAAYVAYGSVFVYQYFQNYADRAAAVFHRDLAAALERAVSAAGAETIYVSNQQHYPGIYALFYTPPPPREYLDTRIVARPNSSFHYPVAFGQFVFTSPLAERASDNLFRQILQAGGLDLKNVAHYVLAADELAELDTDRLILEPYGAYYYAYDPAIVAAGAARGPLLSAARPPISGAPAAPARFSVYWSDKNLTYYKENCTAYDTRKRFFLHLTPAPAADLPAARQPLGFANRDFRFDDYGALYGRNCWAVIPLPDYPIAAIKTGQFIDGKGAVWQTEFAAAQ